MNVYFSRLIPSVVLISAFLLSLLLRWEAFHEAKGSDSPEATYHVIWTLKSLSDSSSGAHLYLPTVTYRPEPGNDIRWGATVPTSGGSYIYTSFPPLGFLLALPAAMMGGDSAFTALALFNSLLGLIAATGFGLLMQLVARLSSRQDIGGPVGQTVFLASAVLYLFLPESLISHGATYWAHSPSQIVFIFATWLALRQMAYPLCRREGAVLLILCLLYPLLEWTGYVFNAGVFLTFKVLAPRFGLRDKAGYLQNLGWLVAGASLLAMAVTLGHMFYGISIRDALIALAKRGVERGVPPGWLGPFQLLIGYVVSLGFLLPAGLAAVIALLAMPDARPVPSVMLALFISAFPMLENLIMSEHAIMFSFDRMKLAIPLGIAVVAVLARFRTIWAKRPMIFAATLFVGIVLASNLALFWHRERGWDAWVPIATENRELVERFETSAGSELADCATWATEGLVRAYLNLLFMRDIYEGRSLAEAQDLMTRNGSCGLVFITAERPFLDMFRLTRIDVWSSDRVLLASHESDTTP